MKLSTIAAFAVAALAANASAQSSPPSGSDTRAFTFTSQIQYQYHGYDSFNERPATYDGSLSSMRSGTDYGTIVGASALYPVSTSYYGYANLGDASLHASVNAATVVENNYNQPPSVYQTNGRSTASLQDTLSFHVLSAIKTNYITLGIRTTLHGTYTSYRPNNGGTAQVVFLYNYKNAYSAFSGEGNVTQYFGEARPNYTNLTDFGSGLYGIDLSLPATDFSLDLNDLLSVNAYGSGVDFSHTSLFSLVLPVGVTYTSQSGVFLTSATGTVPELATWAMMLGGFGIVGLAMRGRGSATAHTT